MSKSDIVERLRSGAAHQTLVTTGLVNQAADEITRLRAEVERLRVENIQMQAALGYGILAEDERHILPTNPFKCGTCDASKHLRAEVERLRAALDGAYNERNRLVAFLARLFPSGLKYTAIPGWDEAWHGCVYIDLPTGQASWHYHDSEAYLFDGLPPYSGDWDGHSTELKYERIARAALGDTHD